MKIRNILWTTAKVGEALVVGCILAVGVALWLKEKFDENSYEPISIPTPEGYDVAWKGAPPSANTGWKQQPMYSTSRKYTGAGPNQWPA